MQKRKRFKSAIIAIFFVIIILFGTLLIQTTLNNSEVIRTEISCSSSFKDLIIAIDEKYVNLTVFIHYYNPSNLDLEIYDISIHLVIYNSTKDEWFDLGLFTGKTLLQAGHSTTLNWTIKVARDTTNVELQHALEAMQLSKSNITRKWMVDGRSNLYILPYNIWNFMMIREVILR